LGLLTSPLCGETPLCGRGVHVTLTLGDLFTYEIVAVDKDLLQLGFLFASGASIVAQFTRLVFRRQRIGRKYPINEKYG